MRHILQASVGSFIYISIILKILPIEVSNPINPPAGCSFRPRCIYAKEHGCVETAPKGQWSLGNLPESSKLASNTKGVSFRRTNQRFQEIKGEKVCGFIFIVTM
jgi:hypothetical protein